MRQLIGYEGHHKPKSRGTSDKRNSMWVWWFRWAWGGGGNLREISYQTQTLLFSLLSLVCPRCSSPEGQALRVRENFVPSSGDAGGAVITSAISSRSK
ncbi:hypothetical protein NA56DRAFT_61917 [Hyaloscypha hepaticicola]|uniref:Uncharacterized protein n=1 Tax=Hyaloscypha hepaticicola TaxID=2082293 RepID=A0A2J6QA74_9HELO|nr:hypothetical protein NA56DRAFT_61917 [Hyaloscypha hepaticicola]